MRVIGGELRSRRLKGVAGMATRPTPDRLRETLFDIVGTRIEGATFLDAYAGTGAVGIEALSRGASHVWFLERSRAALGVLRENLTTLALETRATVVPGPVVPALKQYSVDIVFLDPPYDQEREYGLVLSVLAEAPPSLVVVQHSARLPLEERYGRLQRSRLLRQGDNVLAFYTS